MNCYIDILIKEASKAYKKNEIPVGSIIVRNNKLLSKSHNNRQYKKSVIGHAEILSILKAEKKIKDWRLDDCEMYVTLEPCDMCKTIIEESRINKVYYILPNKNTKVKSDKYIQTNVCKKEYEICKNMLKSFFENMRK